ncbi:DEAD-box ATP-dependent RNA helicase 57 [Picochlorum sp. SENEW3]|nr:DEAD-box ATP-dependent RNA helicase 57 [Picochlorum sp. SENEW3]
MGVLSRRDMETHSHSTSVFDTLTLGIRFDRQSFCQDISIFEKALEETKKRGIEAEKEDHIEDEEEEEDVEEVEDEEKQQGAPREGDDIQTKDPFERANVLRKRNRIKVSGSAPPAPITGFDELEDSGPNARLMANLRLGGFETPTAVQKQAIPALCEGRELMVVAPTGSGKTLAFLIPLIMRVKKQRYENPEVEGIRAVVISPTKELSMQTGRVLMPLLPGLKLRCSVLSKATAAGTDFSKVDILLANPLRLESMAKEGKIQLDNVGTLVLDEADKLFEMGFADQIDACLAACSNDGICRCLCSATLPETVENLARSVLRDPLRITVGERNISATSVEQKLLFVGRENGKLLAIRQLISDGLRPPVLIFVNTKERAKEVHRELMFEGVHVDSLHASQSQAAREKAVEKFRQGTTWVLIATDLVARGLDFAGVETVINMDFPNSTIDYVHRVGRTGRAGRHGKAITFFTEDDVSKLRSVANIIKAAGGDVDPWLLKLKKVRNRNRNRNRVTEEDDEKETKDDKKKKRKPSFLKERGHQPGKVEKKKPLRKSK